MKSTKNRRAVVVGLVIFIGLIIFMAGILTLGGQHKTFAKTVHVRAIFKDINGLQTGNNIWFSGVKVGTIKKITMKDNAAVEVEMRVEEGVQRFIHKDAMAKVGSDGLIGNRIVVIYGGTAGVPAIEEGDMLKVEDQVTNEDILNTLQQNNTNLLAVTTDLKTMTAGIMGGKGTIGRLVNDETLANSLQTTINTLQQTANNARNLSANLNGYTAKFQTPGTFANDLVNDREVFTRLRSSVRQIEEVANNAQSAANDLKQASHGLNDSTGSAIGVLLTSQQAAADLQATLRNLNSGSKKLDEDMEAAQHNFLLRGFFKKKAKREAKEHNP